uniref:Protein S100-A4 n=1 Tax=Equus asinus TaxID=9793 RepID=A0A9L0I4Q9_EQUAS
AEALKPHQPTAGGLSFPLPHPLSWAGPGQGINRSDRWAFPALPLSPTLSPQRFLSLGLKRTDEAAFQKLMSNLDSNKDNEVDFQEYCVFLSCIAMMCNEFFEGFPDKQPRKK